LKSTDGSGRKLTCGLKEKELFILNILYTNRCLSRSRGFHSNKLDRLFKKKFNAKSKDTVKSLRNLGYIASVGKSPEKYYICDIPRAAQALRNHDYRVTRGREHSL